MARYVAGAKSAGAGSTTLTIGSLFSPSGSGFRLREVGLFNTTTTAVDLKLTRLTAQGTPGSAIVAGKYDDASPAAAVTPFNTHTVSATTASGGDLGYRASLGAAIGSGVIWTFGENGIHVAAGTANGIGVLVENGTGQVCQMYFVWDE